MNKFKKEYENPYLKYTFINKENGIDVRIKSKCSNKHLFLSIIATIDSIVENSKVYNKEQDVIMQLVAQLAMRDEETKNKGV